MEKLATQNTPQALDVFRQEQHLQQFRDILGARAPHYVATIASTIAKDKRLQECTPESLVIAALRGAADNLSFDPALAEAYMIGYKNKVKVINDKGKEVTTWITQAAFQYGYKGLIQLGVRTGQYVALGAHPVTMHAFKTLRDRMELSQNPVETAIQFFSMVDFYPELMNGAAIGYIAYFKLTNGFTKMIYWDKQRCIQHGLQFSPSAEGPSNKRRFKDGSFWLTNEDTACLKTVIRQLMLSGEAPKSKEMTAALEQEQHITREVEATPQRLAEAEMRHQKAISNGREDEDLFGVDLTDETLDLSREAIAKNPDLQIITEADKRAKWIVDNRTTSCIGKHMPVAIGYQEDQKARFVFRTPEEWLKKLNAACDQIKIDQAAIKAQNGQQPADPPADSPEDPWFSQEELDRMAKIVVEVFEENSAQTKDFDNAVEAKDRQLVQTIFQAALDTAPEPGEEG